MIATKSLLSPSKGVYSLDNFNSIKNELIENSGYKQSPLKPDSMAIFENLIEKYNKCLNGVLYDSYSNKKVSRALRRRQSLKINRILDKINLSPKIRSFIIIIFLV